MLRGATRTWLPAVLAVAVAASALVEVSVRPPRPVRAELIAAGPAFTPPPLQTAEVATIPSDAPRVVAPRKANAPTSGPNLTAPKPARAYLQIASVGTNAPIVRVGLDANGDMVTPTNAADIAWLDNGSFPGPTRNAILAGHRNWKGRSGALIRLEEAQAGDAIRIGLDGRVFTFSISWVRNYDPENAPVEELLGPTATDSITVVTCGGTFDRNIGHYTKRVVARAELVGVA